MDEERSIEAPALSRRARDFAATLDSVEIALAWARERAPTWVSSEGIDLGLTELVVNAIVHGSSSAGQEPTDARFALLLETSDDTCRFVVEWEVCACPRELRAGRDADLLATSGRGLLIAEAFFDAIVWREDGLAVTGEFRRAEAA